MGSVAVSWLHDLRKALFFSRPKDSPLSVMELELTDHVRNFWQHLRGLKWSNIGSVGCNIPNWENWFGTWPSIGVSFFGLQRDLIIPRTKAIYAIIIYFYHHKSFKLRTRVPLQQPLFHNALLALTFTIQKYWPAWSFSLHILRYPFHAFFFFFFSTLLSLPKPSLRPLQLPPNLQHRYYLFPGIFSELFLPLCSCSYNILCIGISLHSPGSIVYSPVPSTGLLKGRNCPSWIQWVPFSTICCMFLEWSDE